MKTATDATATMCEGPDCAGNPDANAIGVTCPISSRGEKSGTSMIRRFLSYATQSGIPCRSFLVAVVVGTILNLINQGDAAVGGGSVNWTKIGLTFLVPYCVATYGAVSYRLRQERETRPSPSVSSEQL
ncbi:MULTISPECIES: nitrate/nitrite transporter NrtS [Xanthobacter]|uniref:nitrate/nitrite transporter NrtS n=1 Tax=Xanthobacter autotrophicus TaxID=280 RepID=UPI003729ED28